METQQVEAMGEQMMAGKLSSLCAGWSVGMFYISRSWSWSDLNPCVLLYLLHLSSGAKDMMKEFEKMGEKVEPSPVIVAAFTRAGKHVTCSATDPVRYVSQQDDFQDVMDGMMRQVRSLCELDDEGSNTDHCNRDEYSCRQLLSKEVMYEPMRQICERVNYLFVKYPRIPFIFIFMIQVS